MPDNEQESKLSEAKKAVTTVATGYVTAQVVPQKRDFKAILKEAITMAEISGDSYYYRWETSSTNRGTGEKKKGFICGHSVKLTNEAARLFGNCVVQQKPVQSTRESWIFTTSFIDLQTGFTRERQFRMSKKYPIYGKMDQYRKDDIRFQIGQSKADRNVVLNSLPELLTDKMLKAAIASVRTQIEFKIKNVYKGDIDSAVTEVLKKFEEYAITQADIENKLGLQRKSWDIDTLVMFYGDIKALESGEQTATTLYGEHEPDKPEEKKNGLSIDTAKLGDPADHQSVKTDESTPLEQEQKRELTKKETLLSKLLNMSADEKYNTLPGLKPHFETLGTTANDMSEEELEKEITNIEDVRLKYEKAQAQKKSKDDQGQLM